MEVVAVVIAAEALVFVIAFGFALAVDRAEVVLVTGVVIALVSAIIAAMVAIGDSGSIVDFTPVEAFSGVLLAGLFLYVGWVLGIVAATRVRSWAGRRRGA